MVNKTWQLVEQHGCWWAYEGELPPPAAFTTHSRSGHLPILCPFPSRAMAEAQLQRHLSGSQPRSPGQPLTSARMVILMSPLILKRASASRLRGEWDDDYDAQVGCVWGVRRGCGFVLADRPGVQIFSHR
jgi:hypothetical protein